jgi:hypothetical protein
MFLLIKPDRHNETETTERKLKTTRLHFPERAVINSYIPR